MDDLLNEFLTETGESLAVIDVELVKFEQNPNDAAMLQNQVKPLDFQRRNLGVDEQLLSDQSIHDATFEERMVERCRWTSNGAVYAAIAVKTSYVRLAPRQRKANRINPECLAGLARSGHFAHTPSESL